MNDSLDPAMVVAADSNDFDRLEDLIFDPDAVYIFDFDGVITSRHDDEIYKLPPTSRELPLITRAANHFNIKCGNMDQQYQRHLVYQAAAWNLGIPMNTGPGFMFARTAATAARLFVLSARSGWHAIGRCRDFFIQHEILPVETYHVGRVNKDRQIVLLLKQYPNKNLYYVEDSVPHLEFIKELIDDKKLIKGKKITNLYLVYSFENREKLDESILRHHFIDTLQKSLEF